MSVTSIRRLHLGEGELFRQMRLRSLQEAPYAFSSTYESSLSRSPQSWNEQADSTAQGIDRATFIAFSGDSPVGIAALYRHPEGTEQGEVLQVWVDPEHRGTGLAANLLDAVLQWGRASGFAEIRATIARDNTRARGFYQKCGFALSGEVSPDGPDYVILMRTAEPGPEPHSKMGAGIS